MEPYLAQLILFGGNFAPRGWAFCEGQLLPIAQYSALFSLIGTIYGGDGRTTFALPDLRGRAPVAPGTGLGLTSYRLGQRAGIENINITTANLPSHAHTISIEAGSVGNSDNPSGNVVAGNTANSFGTVPNTTLSSENTSFTGGGQPINNIQPVLAINYIICIQGIYPSRN